MLYYMPKHFDIHELVDPLTLQLRGQQAWQLIDPKITYSIDLIRDRYNVPIRVNTYKFVEKYGLENNWLATGEKSGFQYRCFRPKWYPNQAKFSQHYFGRAIDFDIFGITPEEFFIDFKNNHDLDCFKYITGIETGINWIHIDCRPWNIHKSRYCEFKKV